MITKLIFFIATSIKVYVVVNSLTADPDPNYMEDYAKRYNVTLGWKRRLVLPYFGKGPHKLIRAFDRMGTSEKHFIANNSDELVRDAKLKMRMTTGPRKKHEPFMAYHIGLVVGKIREKYRNMLDLYREGQDFRHHRFSLFVPAVLEEQLEHYFIYFELIRRYEVHIDHLVNVLEGIKEPLWAGGQGGVLNRSNFEARQYGRRRFNDKDTFKKQKKKMAEEKIKHNIRQRYLVKRMGLPLNSTTAKKRFINQWPVMKTWKDYFAEMY